MNNKRIGASIDNAACQRIQRDFRVLIVNADAAFHGDGNADRALHGIDALRDQRRLRHQASAKAAVLHPVRWAADIEIDFVVAEILADLGACSEVARIRTAEL